MSARAAGGARRGLVLAGLAALSSGACAPGASIERRDGARVVTGRVVSSEAYAWYARGVRHETEGRRGEAEAAYRRALHLDPEGGSTWAALGRLACARSLEEARVVLERGLEQATEKLPVLLSEAECALEHDDTEAARDGALRALRLAPEDPEVTRVLEKSALARGKMEEARRYRVAYEAWTGLRGLRAPRALPDDTFGSLGEIDRLLLRGELEDARQAAVGTIPPDRLCSRLLALGHEGLARAEAERVLQSSPDSADALLVHALTEPVESVARALAPPADPFRLVARDDLERLSPLGLLLLAEYLSRHVDLEAGRAFLRRLDFQPSADPREREVARRLGYERKRHASLRL